MLNRAGAHAGETFSQRQPGERIPTGQGSRGKLTPFLPARLSPYSRDNIGGGRGTWLDNRVLVKPTQTL